MYYCLLRVTSEKNSALLRNAELSQQMEMAKQETRRQETEMADLSNKINLLEDEIKAFKEKENRNVEQDLKNTIAQLEEQVVDKNKVLFSLEERLFIK